MTTITAEMALGQVERWRKIQARVEAMAAKQALDAETLAREKLAAAVKEAQRQEVFRGMVRKEVDEVARALKLEVQLYGADDKSIVSVIARGVHHMISIREDTTARGLLLLKLSDALRCKPTINYPHDWCAGEEILQQTACEPGDLLLTVASMLTRQNEGILSEE